MLVIAAAAVPGGLSWRGRRHDDDAPGASRGDSVAGLFDCVFSALHDGEQVAVGFAGQLVAPQAAAPATAWEQGSGPEVVSRLAELLTELGRWRPWTVVSTSLPRWRATTSVLVWESDESSGAAGIELDDNVEAFYALVRDRADPRPTRAAGDVVNLAATSALRAGLTVDPSQLGEPVVHVSRNAAGRPA